MSGCPRPFGSAEQIDRSFLDAVVRQVSDYDFVSGNAPILSGCFPISAGAFVGPDAQPLKDDTLRPDAERDGRVAFATGLNEHPVGLVQEPAQVRLRVLLARGVVRVVWVAEVKERREQERHAAPAREPEPTQNRERIRESCGVDGIERTIVPVRIPPHRWADGIARRREALPAPVRQKRKRFQDVAACREVQRGILHHRKMTCHLGERGA
nr:hypothetical protein [Frigoriglobus tundricola]